jgi:integrase/recombinase XerD
MGTDLDKLRHLPELHHPNSALGSHALPAGSLTYADTDDEIVALWLRRPGLSPRTVRSSRKEAERFLFWIRVHGKGLRQVRIEDLLAYAHFITDPQPADQWVSSTKLHRTDPGWRPFCGPLGESSQRQALTILKGLFRWARAAEYLAGNPAELLGSMSVVHDDEITRFLPVVAISLLMEAADRMATDVPGAVLRQARSRFTVMAFYLTAARLNELVTADMSSIRRDHKGLWWIHVDGKGKKKGKVPVPPDLLAEFKRYRQTFGLAALPPPRDTTPLLLTTRGPQRRATHYTVANSVKAVMKSAQEHAQAAGLDEVADRIKQASTHWLRHSSLTHQVDAAVPLKTVQRNARHASLKTTGRYIHKEDEQRHAETVGAITIVPLPAS